jgi:hypothetical protein
MLPVQGGQCGICAHVGENDPSKTPLIQIRLKHDAPEQLTEPCGHPKLASLDLVVTPIGGCKGFEPVDPQA